MSGKGKGKRDFILILFPGQTNPTTECLFNFASVWFRFGSVLVQFWFSFGSVVVQISLCWLVLVQLRFRFGSGLVQFGSYYCACHYHDHSRCCCCTCCCCYYCACHYHDHSKLFLMRYSMLFFRSGFLFSPQAGPRAAKE